MGLEQKEWLNPVTKDYKEYCITTVEIFCPGCSTKIKMPAIPLVVDYKQQAEFYRELSFKLQQEINRLVESHRLELVDKLPDDIKKVQ